MEIGVAYYPEHWPESRWEDDFALMRQAGITLVRMAEFAWCRLEPTEGQFDFAWLDRAVAMAQRHGIRSILCTPTEAPPPWLSVNYPETRPWNKMGLPYAIGSRRHVDPASPAFVHFSDQITRAMGQHYGHNAAVAGWQLDNEIGAHTHFVSTSPAMAVRFRQWLQKKYGTIEKFNQELGMVFWSGEVRQWSEVEILTQAPTGVSPSYTKMVRDFGQELWLEFLRRQAEILRPLCPGQFITHNIAWYGEQIDIWKMSQFLDVVGIDHYARRAETLTATADLYHAAGQGKPWAVLEMGASDGHYQTAQKAGPSRGWLTGALVKFALSGAKFASMFRFMCSPSGWEQGSEDQMRDAWGRPSENVHSVAAARRIIDKLKPILARPRRADIAILQDTDDLIYFEMQPVEGRARDYANDYVREVQEIHYQLSSRGHRPTFTSLEQDLGRFGTVFLWNKLLIKPEQAQTLRQYVENGGTLVLGYCLGFLNASARRNIGPLPFGLTDVFGCTVRQMLHIPRGMAPRLLLGDKGVEVAHHGVLLENLGGRELASWQGWEGPYRSGIVANRYGKGRTIYIGALLDRPGWDIVMPMVMQELGLPNTNPITPHPELEVFPERGCWVAVNTGHEPLQTPIKGRYRDWVSEQPVQETLRLPPYGIAVLEG